MKKTARKLKLNRETLRNLTEPKLRAIVGGGGGDIVSIQDTNCTGCDTSPLCGPTMQAGCEITQ